MFKKNLLLAAGTIIMLMVATFISFYSFCSPKEKNISTKQSVTNNGSALNPTIADSSSKNMSLNNMSEIDKQIANLSPAELYEKALKAKDLMADQPEQKNILIASCLKIVENYTDSPEAQKAMEVLKSIDEEDVRRYAGRNNTTSFEQTKVKRSKSFRR